MDINEFDGISLNPSGGGGGGGSQNAHVTSTQTNPVVPSGFEGLADMLRNIATGMGGAPVNFGRTGLDAPSSGPLIPQASMGSLFSSPAFMNGFNRLGVNGGGSRMRFGGSGVVPQPTPINPPQLKNTWKNPRTYGDMFSMDVPGSYMPSDPYTIKPRTGTNAPAAMTQ